MAMSALFDALEPSRANRSNEGLAEDARSRTGNPEDRSEISLVPERTSDLVAITTFSLSRYVYISPSHKRILGYDPSDLLNRSPFDFIHPDDIHNLFPLLQKYVASLPREDGPHGDLGLCTERMVYRIRDRWGNWRSVEATGDLLSDDLIVFISRDVTERVKAENDLFGSSIALQATVEERTRALTSATQALQENEKRYKNILDSIEDGYYEVDLVGNMTFFNDASCRITGYSPSELQGMNHTRYTGPDTAKRMFEIFNRVYRTGEPAKISDYEVVKKDGTKCVVELSTSLILDQEGKGIGFRGIARDITERIAARRALEESEEKYRTILESIEDGYYEVDIAGNMVFFNDSMCKILGYSPDELKGMNNRRFMGEETAKTVYRTFNHVYCSGEATKVLGWELVQKNGQKRYVETSVSLVRDREGKPVGFRGIARDITEHKLMEKAKERMINHLSHELGTPISIIESALVRIVKGAEKGDLGKIAEWAERSLRNVNRLKDLKAKVDDILKGKVAEGRERILHFIDAAINQLEELKDEPLKEGAEIIRQSIVRRLEDLYKAEEITNEAIPVGAFLEEVCSDAIQSMRGRQIEIVRNLEEGISIEMDRKVLRRICDGFLRNAIENTPDEGRIKVQMQQGHGSVRVDFQDFGVGITPENQRLIFGGFFHTQDSHLYTSRKPYLFNAGGAGADLLRAKILSERLKFSLEFSSARCRYLPSDKDECPGRISLCPFIKGREDCLGSGGSVFSLLLPMHSTKTT